MIHNVESLTDISYVACYSDPDRENEVLDEEDTRLSRYCHGLEIAVFACEVLTVISLVLCAFLI